MLLLKVLFIKSIKCSQEDAAFHCAASDMFLTGWWNQINWLYHKSVIRGVRVVCGLIQRSGLQTCLWRRNLLRAAVKSMIMHHV